MGRQVPLRHVREGVVFALLRINWGAGTYPPPPLPHQGSLPWSAPARDPPASRRVSARSSVGHCRLRGQALRFPLLLNPLWSRVLTLPPT